MSAYCDYDWILPGKLALGGAPEGPRVLRTSAGAPLFDLVVDLRTAEERGLTPTDAASWEPVQLLRKPWRDGDSSVSVYFTVNDLGDVVPTVRRALADGRRALVHCRFGRSRSATVAAAVLIAEEGLSVPDAMAMVRAQRPIAQFPAGFAALLSQWNAQRP